MTVTEAVARRKSVRAFRSDPVSSDVVLGILRDALRAPSGGNLQPWKVHALAGEALSSLITLAQARMAQGGETPDYSVYPANLWEPFRSRRFAVGEDLYGALGLAREDKASRLRQAAENLRFFGAPVGLFFTLDRRLGPPQWADVGMYMQTVMLLAVERGLDTCAQEFWSNLPRTVGDYLELDPQEILFSGMALGYRDETAPINGWRSRREPVEAMATLSGF